MGNLYTKKIPSKKNSIQRSVEKSLDKNSKIKIVRFNFNGKMSNFICDEEELFSNQISKFKERNGKKDLNLSFISNGEEISPDMKLNQIHNFNQNELCIEVFERNLVKGGTPINFTDLSKQIHEEHYFSDKAPSYRIVSKGINIYGKCNGKDCIARKKIVIIPLKNIIEFDLIGEKEKLICPKCESFIIPKTVGFHLCEYRISGIKFNDNDNQTRNFEFSGIANSENSIQYFNPEENGSTLMIKLKIEVTKFL